MTPVRFDATPEDDPKPKEPAPEGEKPGTPEELGLPRAADEPSQGTPAGLTLDQAINLTLLMDPKIRAGLEAINQANADALTAALKPNPSLALSQTLLPLTRPFTVDKQGGPPQFDAGISYSIDWLLFGKRAAAMASAAAGVRISEAEYADLVRQRVTETAVAFFDVLEARALLGLARQDLANLRQLEEATEKSFKDGGRSQVELDRVRLDRLASEQARREAELALAHAQARLQAVLGRKDVGPAFDVAGSLEAPLTAQPLPVEEAMALAEQNRPDIRSLRLQIDKAARDVHVEKTNAYPEVTPKVGYTRQFQQKAIGFPDVNDWGVGVDLSLPVCNRNQGNIAKARSVLTQNALNLEAGLVDLRSEIVQVVQEYQTAYRIASAVGSEQRRLAADVRDRLERSFREKGSRTTLIDVLDARRNFLTTSRLYFTSRANYWRAVYRFHSAIGQQVGPHDGHPCEPRAAAHP